MNNYVLKYKKFDSLVDDVMLSFKNYTLENLIDPQDLISVAKWVTADLGLRIYKTQETILELNHHKVKLPDDFYVFNYGLLCGEGMITIPVPQGTHMEEIPFPIQYNSVPDDNIDICTDGEICPKPVCGGCNNCDICNPGLVIIPGYNTLRPYGDPCVKPRVFMNCKGDAFELVQILQTQMHKWKMMLPLRLVNNTHEISQDCPNLHFNCSEHVWIKDGFLHSNLDHGKIYLNYQGALEDVDGNLLVVDDPILTLYYEYKLKDRILEDLFNNGEDVERRIDRNSIRLRNARIEAKNKVNTPDFEEMNRTWKLNRRAFNARYVDMFRTYNWLSIPYGTRI